MNSPSTEITAPLLEGRYQLVECVGAGGMATVYRALDTALGRTVAVKMVRTELEGAGARSARSESAALASLSHPGLVTLFDARFAPGGPEYLVMEFVDGPTLGDRIRRGPLPAADVAHLGRELAEALHAVHAAGVVHRDVKPSNVLLAPATTPGLAYRAKLADFGIAYLLGTERLTSPGVVVGTLSYLAPEQLRGAAPTPAADIYALGVVLLEALTGHRAFSPTAPAEAMAARHAMTVELPGDLPPAWARLLRRMTADHPAARPSAIEVALEADALAAPRESVARAPVSAAPTPAPSPAPTVSLPRTGPLPAPERRPRPRRRRRSAAAVALAAAVVSGGAFALDALSGMGAPVVTEQSVEPKAPAVMPPVPTRGDETTTSAGSGADAPPPGPGEAVRTVHGDPGRTGDGSASDARAEDRPATHGGANGGGRHAEERREPAEEAPQNSRHDNAGASPERGDD